MKFSGGQLHEALDESHEHGGGRHGPQRRPEVLGAAHLQEGVSNSEQIILHCVLRYTCLKTNATAWAMFVVCCPNWGFFLLLLARSAILVARFAASYPHM